MKHFALLCAFFILYTGMSAQTEFRSGVVIFSPLDADSGLIGYRSDLFCAERCISKSATGTVREYLPFEITGYHYTQGKVYISKYVKMRSKVIPFFVEYLVKGRKNLYFLKDDAGPHFLIDVAKDTVTEVVYRENRVFRDGVEYLEDPKIHQAYLKSYFSDCPDLAGKIEGINVPDMTSMISLTLEYHKRICPDSLCMVFYKKPYRFHFDLELRFSYIRCPDYDTRFEPQYSVLAHFWIPSSNERMYLITGFSYSPLKNYGVTYSMYKVPLKFEYMLPFRWIKPHFEGGVNFMVVSEKSMQTGLGIDFPISAGVLVCPSEYFGFDFSVESETIPFIFMQEFKISHLLMAYSFNAGLVIRF